MRNVEHRKRATGYWHPVSGIRHLTSVFCFLSSVLWSLVTGIRPPASDICLLSSVLWSLATGTRHLASGIRYPASGI